MVERGRYGGAKHPMAVRSATRQAGIGAARPSLARSGEARQERLCTAWNGYARYRGADVVEQSKAGFGEADTVKQGNVRAGCARLAGNGCAGR